MTDKAQLRKAPIVEDLERHLEALLGTEVADLSPKELADAVEAHRLKPTYPQAVADMTSALKLEGSLSVTYEFCLSEAERFRRDRDALRLSLVEQSHKHDAERVQLTGALGLDAKASWSEVLSAVAYFATHDREDVQEASDPDRVVQRPLIDGIRARILREALTAIYKFVSPDSTVYARAEATLASDTLLARWNGKGSSR